MDKEFWKKQLENLDEKELNEVSKIIEKYKKDINKREELIDVLKRYAEKFPSVKYFCTGCAGKGAYECEGEWDYNEWNQVYRLNDLWDELVDTDENEDRGNVEILQEFKNGEEWENSCLNNYVKADKQFNKDFNNALHKPTWSFDDADGLENGEDMYEFIEIATGEKKYLYTSSY